MILHRLRLTNFRGVADRELTFPENGVVVVCGPNEVGKSSMPEALDLLLEHKDRSSKQKVMAVRPTHADVGAEVEAEISSGPYRFVYRKRFHKKHLTELTVLEPERRHHSGDEAHERVRAMLDETVDAGLWQAQRVLQAGSTAAVDLSGCDALSRALDVAAGEADSSGNDAPLIDAVNAEFERYFTPNAGRPAREWKGAIERLAAAEQAVERAGAAVAEVEERVRRHEELNAQRRGLADALAPAAARAEAARQTHATLIELTEQVRQAEMVAEAAAVKATALASVSSQRAQLKADVERRSDTLVALQTQLSAATEEEAIARETLAAAKAESDAAAVDLAAAQSRMDAARSAEQACAAREVTARLAARVERIDEARRDLQQTRRELAEILLTAVMFADIETSHAVVEQLEAQLDTDTGSVEFTAIAALDFLVDGEAMMLSAGQTWRPPACAPVAVEIPGLLNVRLDPGAAAAQLSAKLVTARQLRAEALSQGGVADLAVARAVDTRRRELATRADQLTAKLDGLCAGDDIDDLRRRHAELSAEAGETGGEIDPAVVAIEIRAAADALETACARAEACRGAVVAAAAALNERDTAAKVLCERMSAAETELKAVTDQLAELCAGAPDDAVIAAAAEAAEAQLIAEEQLAALTARYRAANPDHVRAQLDAAAAALSEITDGLAAIDRELDTLNAQLEIIGNEGRRGLLDDAEIRCERARADHATIGGRAGAVKLLRDTMMRHRDNARQRYVKPYRNELERLGRMVFGPSFAVEVDSNLTICSRTLDGCTVPYESLSGGAKEQLGILARLAGAALVAEEDTVPVVIDDALGFSDPDRLTKMSAVFGNVGHCGQVIVLTCQRDRYKDISGAKVIELTA
jgi:DNA repair exonuclease SbcCD ATPase subunit